MPAKLGVNVDHVATLRQARGVTEPDPVTAAALAELAGADGITIHLREDARHIQERDVRLLRQTVKTRLNLEMAGTDAMVELAMELQPDSVTLVPERREELTTEGGLDVALHRHLIKKQTDLLRQAGVIVSLFVDPELEQLKAAHRVGADYIEIHTGRYCDARTPVGINAELEKISNAVRAARKLGLGVNAGHGLNYKNSQAVIALGGIEEFNIGHSIISRAVLVGIDQAVREMVEIIKGRG